MQSRSLTIRAKKSVSVVLFVACPRFEFRFVHEGDMALDPAVVERVIGAGGEVAEERAQVDDASDEEPEKVEITPRLVMKK